MQSDLLSPNASYKDSKEVPRFDNAPNISSDLNTSNKAEQLDFGGIDCPAVPGFQEPIQDFASLIGRNRGIQGHQNSCYLDATLFAMFSFTR